MELDNSSSKLKVKYPCKWDYKVIGLNKDFIEKAVVEVIKGKEYSINISNNSKTGKYCSMNLELEVGSEKERDSIYLALKNHSDIIMLL